MSRKQKRDREVSSSPTGKLFHLAYELASFRKGDLPPADVARIAHAAAVCYRIVAENEPIPPRRSEAYARAAFSFFASGSPADAYEMAKEALAIADVGRHPFETVRLTILVRYAGQKNPFDPQVIREESQHHQTAEKGTWYVRPRGAAMSLPDTAVPG